MRGAPPERRHAFAVETAVIAANDRQVGATGHFNVYRHQPPVLVSVHLGANGKSDSLARAQAMQIVEIGYGARCRQRILRRDALSNYNVVKRIAASQDDAD